MPILGANWTTDPSASLGPMRRILTIGLSLSMILAACSSDDGDGAGDSSTSTSPRHDDDRTRGRTVDHGHHSGHVDHVRPPRAHPEGSGGDSCLVGTWEFDLEDFVDTMREIAAEEGELPDDFEITPSDGSYLIEMRSDGTLEGVRGRLGFRL